LRRAAARIDQYECGLPVVTTGSEVRDAPTAGSDISQHGDGSELVVRRRESDSKHADVAACRRIEFDRAAFIGGDWESLSGVGQHEGGVAVARQRDRGSWGADLRTGIVANHYRNVGCLGRNILQSHP
jgi:hypothetical protein